MSADLSYTCTRRISIIRGPVEAFSALRQFKAAGAVYVGEVTFLCVDIVCNKEYFW